MRRVVYIHCGFSCLRGVLSLYQVVLHCLLILFIALPSMLRYDDLVLRLYPVVEVGRSMMLLIDAWLAGFPPSSVHNAPATKAR